MKMLVKICGMQRTENVKEVSQIHPDFMGFIMYPPSSRFVEESSLANLLNSIHEQIATVAVFVNEKVEEVIRICKKYNFSFAQLHGSESSEECKKIKEEGIGVLKAISVSDTINFDEIKAYEPHVDYFLFDTKTIGHGGSGKHFNWDLLKMYPLKTPYFLSGGIGDDDIELIKELNLPGLLGIDANSRLEIEPGLKDVNASSLLIEQIRNL